MHALGPALRGARRRRHPGQQRRGQGDHRQALLDPTRSSPTVSNPGRGERANEIGVAIGAPRWLAQHTRLRPLDAVRNFIAPILGGLDPHRRPDPLDEPTWLTEGFRPRRKRHEPQRVEVPVAEPTQSAHRMVVCHFIVSDDVERSRRFYSEVLGGRVVFGPEPTNIALANSFIIINGGGGPTDDKPTVTLETPSDPDRVSSFLNIRVADIHAVYAEWSGAVPDAAEAARVRDPLLHPRSRRLPHRGRTNHRPTRRLVARRLATDQPRRAIRLNPVSSMSATIVLSEVVPLPLPRPVAVAHS